MKHVGGTIWGRWALAIAGCCAAFTGLACGATATASAKTTWLCRPGLAVDPCRTSTATTVLGADGATTTLPPLATRASRRKVDCFYVYPTVSSGTTLNAPAQVTPEIQSVATLQASRFSSLCRVFAPVYPQLTVHARGLPIAQQVPGAKKAYAVVAAAWKDYLAQDNHGRGVILIGHSQGTGMLRRLVTEQIDPSPARRRQLVAAYLLGGDVTVRDGSDRGGDFVHVPACRTGAQLGCVIAYSSFTHEPPSPTMFGRLPSPVRAVYGGRNSAVGVHVLCVDPGRLAGTPGRLAPYLPTNGTPPWTTYPGRYSGACQSRDGADWLQVTPLGGDADPRPIVGEPLGPTWGNHLFDIDIAYGQLVAIAGRQAAAYARRATR